jgi:arylsulfatase A-like enzyme
MKKISRRDFIKLGWGAVQAAAASSMVTRAGLAARAGAASQPNVVMLICDAMSAKNLSLYGYPRKTTPNLEKLAERAFVYHNHYANGNYTTPGTSSLLTGLLPWTHRAVNNAATIKKSLSTHNIFNLLGSDYFKMAYTQNYWANYLLNQFAADIDDLLPFSDYGLINENVNNKFFKNDLAISHRAVEKMLYYGNSLLLSFLTDLYYRPRTTAEIKQEYPGGFPTSGIHHNVFTMEDLFDGLSAKILDLHELQRPFFSYFHIFPPHYPYNAHRDFYGMFDNDGYIATSKREHTLSAGVPESALDAQRNQYDAYLANLDMHIGLLMDKLEKQGVLQDTYFIITSDHGEMFERGTHGHTTAMLYEPVIKIPLMIFAPNHTTRQDFTAPTSSVDLLPTILKLAGQPISSDCEGNFLPGFGNEELSNRSVFIVEATQSSAFQPFTKATYSIIKDEYKLLYYHGYQHKYQDYFEFYDLREDPQELNNKYSQPKFAPLVSSLKEELLTAIEEANKKIGF